MSSFIDQDNINEKNQDYKDFWRLSPHMLKFKNTFLIGIILMLGSGSIVVGSSKLLGQLVDKGIQQPDLAWKLAAGIVSCELLAVLFLWQGRKLLAKASGQSIFEIRKETFKHLGQLPMSYFDRQPQGRIVTRITNDIEGLEDFLSGGMGRILNAFIIFFTALIAMVSTDYKLGLAMGISSLPALYLTMGFQKNLRTINRQMSRLGAICNSQLAEYINGITVIRSYGLESWTITQYKNKINDWIASIMLANNFYSWNRPLLIFLCQVPLILLFICVGTQTLTTGLELATIVTLIRFCERFTSPMITLAREFHVVQQAFTSAERVGTFLKEQGEQETLLSSGDFNPDKLNGSIQFQNVTMAYDQNNPVLKKVNFNIRPGEKIGLIGATGSGKSTTVSLILRLYDYQEGEILIDDREIHTYNRQAIRRHIGFVSQDPVLFNGSLRENLQGEVFQEDSEILKACEQTGLLQIMRGRQLNLDTALVGQGDNLSQGEKQLVALTRVLLKNPAILILDEATANIDPYFEKLIHQAVDIIMNNRTCLIIAHRLDTIEHCDRLLVFEKGELIEQGPASELLALGGKFSKLREAYRTHQSI